MGSPSCSVLVATSSTAGAAALQSGRAGQQREAPCFLEHGEEALSLLIGFWHCALCVARSLPAAGSCVCQGARAISPSSSSCHIKPCSGTPLRKTPTFSCLFCWHIWKSLGFSGRGMHTLSSCSSSLHCTLARQRLAGGKGRGSRQSPWACLP